MKGEARFPVSDHCDGRVFFNPDRAGTRTLREILRWKATSRPARWPNSVKYAHLPLSSAAKSTCRVTWINHSTFLIQTSYGNFLTDPVFSDRCGIFGLLGPKRVHAPALKLHELPEIHYVLLSHDHYDHCDLASLRSLACAHDPIAITPLGNGSLLRRAGIERVIELDWWQTHALARSMGVTVIPAHHWSNRLSGRRCGRLWGGFHIQAGENRLVFTGDTAYDKPMHVAVPERLGSPDLAMIPIGAYEPRWFMRDQHCNPQEAVQIHLDLQARMSVGMHWGTFQLTDESYDAPIHALTEACKAAGVSSEDFRIMEPGGSVVVTNKRLDGKDVHRTATPASAHT